MLVLSVIGMIVSIILTHHFYELRNGTAAFRTFCHLNQTFNCDAVTASAFAELISGIPLSSVATGWYLGLSLVILLAFMRSWRVETSRALLGMSLLGLCSSAFYLYIMAARLHTFCLLCLVVDGINLCLFGLALFSRIAPQPHSKFQLSQWKVILSAVLGSIFVCIVLLRSWDEMAQHSSDLAELADSVLSSPVVDIPIDSEPLAIGPKTAPIRIVEFSDYQCPFCRIGAQSLNAVYNRYPGKIRIEFYNFPLDPTCNPEMKQQAHPFACEAARVAVCSQEQGKFEAVYETLFERQKELAKGKPLQFAKDVGVDGARLQACITQPSTDQTILKNIQKATAAGVKATPTFFVNGHKMEGPHPVPTWIRIIDNLLKK